MFSLYRRATDVRATTEAAPDSQQSSLWLVYVGRAITPNALVRRDHHHLYAESWYEDRNCRYRLDHSGMLALGTD